MKFILVLAIVIFVVAIVAPGQAEETKIQSDRDPGRHCTPGTTFKKDCNTCTCNDDGTSAVCTLIGCLSRYQGRQRREISCTPGTTFKDKCNTCTCGENGRTAICTLKACLGHS